MIKNLVSIGSPYQNPSQVNLVNINGSIISYFLKI